MTKPSLFIPLGLTTLLTGCFAPASDRDLEPEVDASTGQAPSAPAASSETDGDDEGSTGHDPDDPDGPNDPINPSETDGDEPPADTDGDEPPADTDGDEPPADTDGDQPPPDADGDGDPDDDDCAPLDPAVFHGAAELCNEIDDNCVDGIDELWVTLGDACDAEDPDVCLDGVVVCAPEGDGVMCNDGETTENAQEVCNGADDDCNGIADDPWTAQLGVPCDGNDGDQCANGVWACNGAGSGLSCVGDSNILEICNGIDDDCDGSVDEGCDDDNDDYCDDNMTIVGTPATCTAGGGDCHDGSASRNPAATEVCNAVDDDCDGLLDAQDPDTSYPPTDGYEPNPLYASAPELFEDANPTVAFGPTEPTSFGSATDVDSYWWDDLANEPPPPFLICRLTGMTAAMRTRIQLGYRRSGDPGFPYLYETFTCDPQGNGAWCYMSIDDITIGPDEYSFMVSVIPDSGIDECNADYDLQCKLSYTASW